MNDTYDIPPITITKVQVITKFNVRVVEMVLFKSCSLGVTFYDNEGKFVEYRTFWLEGDDYTNWTNDAYLIDLVSQRHFGYNFSKGIIAMELTESFYVFFVSSILACLGLGMRTLYKSKCIRFSCCGIMIERDVVGEERIDNVQLQRVNSQENNI